MADVLEHEEEQAVHMTDDAAESAAFEAAFNTARDITPAAAGTSTDADKDAATLEVKTATEPTEEEKAAAAATAQAKAEEEARAKAEAEANAPAVITKAELDALRAAAARVAQIDTEFAGQNQKLFGHLGAMKQKILDEVKGMQAKGKAPTKLQLARMEKEFPELAAVLQEDLTGYFGDGEASTAAPATEEATAKSGDGTPGAEAPGATTQTEAQNDDPLARPEVQKLLREKEMSIVDALHPGWKDMTKTSDFIQWKKSLPTAAQQLLGSTWDSKVLNDAFTSFREHQARAKAVEEENKQRSKKLERAIPPVGGAAPVNAVVDEESAMVAAFNKTRGR